MKNLCIPINLVIQLFLFQPWKVVVRLIFLHAATFGIAKVTGDFANDGVGMTFSNSISDLGFSLKQSPPINSQGFFFQYCLFAIVRDLFVFPSKLASFLIYSLSLSLSLSLYIYIYIYIYIYLSIFRSLSPS